MYPPSVLSGVVFIESYELQLGIGSICGLDDEDAILQWQNPVTWRSECKCTILSRFVRQWRGSPPNLQHTRSQALLSLR